jgi:hypothetical protein
MGQRAAGRAAEEVDVAGHDATSGAAFAADPHRHVGEPRVQRTQHVGQLEIAEPATEAGGNGLAPCALRQRGRGFALRLQGDPRA